jgi:uncharacterized membrane protein
MLKKNKWLILILIAATAVRLYKITAISLWHDEAFSALLIKYPWHEMFYRIGLDVHPPLYYILLRFWSYIFGYSLFSLRGFSLFFGVATIYATFLFVKSAFQKENVALAASALTALSLFQIQYVTEARMYTFGTFILMLSAYFLVVALKRDSWKYWLLFVLATSLCIYTHYYLFFSCFAIGLFALYAIHKKHSFEEVAAYKKFVVAYFLVFLSFLPWLKTFLFQFGQVQNNYWIPKMDKWSIPFTNWRLLTGSGDSSALRTHVTLILAILFSLYIIYRLAKNEASENKWLVIFALIIPFAGAVLLSLKQSIYLDRYFLFAGLFYSIALVLFIFQLKRSLLRNALLLLILGINLFYWANYWKVLNVDQKPGMAAAAAFLNNNVVPGDKLIVASSFEFFNFKYYNKTGQTPLLYTPGINKVSDLPHYSGTALLNDTDLIHDLGPSSAIQNNKLVWVLWTNGFGGTKPILPANWSLLNEQSWQDVRPYVGTTIYVDEYKVGGFYAAGKSLNYTLRH